MRFFHPMLKTDLMTLWIVVTSSLCLGLLINQFRDKPLPLMYQTKEERVMKDIGQIASGKTAVPTSLETVPDYIGLEEFRAISEGGKGIILDARAEIFHRLGHVPNALSLPREDFQNAYARHRNILEADKSALLAIYCSSSSCEDSDLLRKALRGLGYVRVTVFKGGWSAWKAAGLPEKQNP